MNNTYRTEYISFFNRSIRRLVPMVLVFGIIAIKIFYRKPSLGFGDFNAYFLVFMIASFIVGCIFNLNQIRTWVGEIQFAGDQIIVVAYDFNKKMPERFDIEKTSIEIKLDEKRKSGHAYYLEISSGDTYYYVNKSFNWNYATLLQIIDDYKSRTNRTVYGMEYYADLVARKNKKPSVLASYFG